MASSMIASLLLLVAFPWTVTSDTHGGKFLGMKMSKKSIRQELQGILTEVLGHAHGVNHARLNKIRNVLTPMFRALPKNKAGKLASPVMRYTVRRYFSQQHAWTLKGFEPHADIMPTSAAEDGDILQEKVPDFIRSVLENQFKHEGFGLEDTVAMVAALERLAFDEVVKSVELAYHLNSRAFTAQMSTDELMEVISSYLIIEMLEGTDDKEQHKLDKENILERYPNWNTTFAFLVDVVSSDGFQRRNSVNPFVGSQTFNFEDVTRLAEMVSEQFGPWSNHECHEMRDMLTKYDVHNTGRVRVTDFYRSTTEGAWQFLEPTQFLRQNGALDESSSYLGPQVIIANYIAGMSNCITSAPYYQICCLNDCDQVFQHIESLIPSPTASTSQIAEAVESLPQGVSVQAELLTWLNDIASMHAGQIPIHGRLLAQWLHFAFPHECPYPHLGGLDPKTQEQWRAQVGEEAESVTEEEVLRHLEAESSHLAPSKDAGKGMWVLQESLMESSTPSDGSSVGRALRLAAQLGMIGCFGVMAFKKIQDMTPTKSKAFEYNV